MAEGNVREVRPLGEVGDLAFVRRSVDKQPRSFCAGPRGGNSLWFGNADQNPPWPVQKGEGLSSRLGFPLS